jgi:lysophospholipase L1-like esterase
MNLMKIKALLLVSLLLCSLQVFVQSPECINRQSLNGYDAQVGKIKAKQDAVVNIVWLGDSLTVQEFITEALRRDLHDQFGDAGVGFIRFDSSGYPISTIVHSKGLWTERYQSPDALGLHISDSTSSERGASKWAFINGFYNVDSITIHYIRQPGGGKFRYRVDDGKWKKVKTKGQTLQLGTRQIDLPSANHSLTVEVLKGTVTLVGADFQLGSKGVKLHMIGNTGSKASQWAQVNADLWQQGLAALNPNLVVIQFSTNEQSQLETPALMVAAYRTLISRIRAAAPTADVLLTTDPDTANSVNPAYLPTSAYRDAVRELALSLGVGFVDFYERLGPYADANARGLYLDPVHPNQAGGKMLADFVRSYLNKECAGGN